MQKSGSQLQDSLKRDQCLSGGVLYVFLQKIMAVRDSLEDLIGGVPAIRYQMDQSKRQRGYKVSGEAGPQSRKFTES